MILRRFFLSCCLLSCIHPTWAQRLKGIVLDSISGAELSYANVIVEKRSIGTITTNNGRFELDISSCTASDGIRFSYIGYKSVLYPISVLSKTEASIIKLVPEPFNLSSVQVESNVSYKKVGNLRAGRTYSGWGDFESLRGRTRGILVNVDGPAKVKSFNFRINHNEWDSVRFRLNLFRHSQNGSDSTLLKENIFVTTSAKYRWVTKDLSVYGIIVSEEVILTLEWVDAWGKTGKYSNLLTISESNQPGIAFQKEAGQLTGSFVEAQHPPSIYIEIIQ